VLTLLEIGLTNAVAATLLALLVLVLGLLLRRRPALMHSLWLIVLLMLIAPPLFSIPVLTLPASVQVTPPNGADLAQSTLLPELPPAPDDLLPPPVILEDEIQIASADAGASPELGMAPPVEDKTPEASVPPAATIASAAATDEGVFTLVDLAAYWPEIVAGIWLAGILAWLGLVVVRVTRFSCVLRHAEPAPAEMQERAVYLAARLGMRRSPIVYLAPGAISPMLWALGWQARLILPVQLVERLRWSQIDTLLLHELAHVRRRDHWVRWLELAVTALYWWHPVVWWARRELREMEEQCCDAWVVWALPQAARSYAIALLETVDFLSDTRTVLPLAASGLGHVHDLKRRLIMIMRGRTPRALTWAGCLLVVGMGATILAVRPTLAQAPPRDERERREPEKRREGERRDAEKRETERPREAGRDRGGDRGGPELEQARNQVREMAEQMEKMQRQMRELQERFQQAQERLHQMEGGRGSDRPGFPGPGAGRGATGGGGAGGFPGAPGAPGGPGAGPGAPGGAGGPGATPGAGGGFGRGGFGGGGMGGFGGFGGGRADGDINRRLEEMEKKLDNLIREFERSRGGDRGPTRREGGDRAAPGTPAGPRPPSGDAPKRDREENVVR
jgi:beta-lactamase regulating signal transducer with metallopeptidase domain